jgi:c-di-GMP-binding flagellar brake protein YcgR
MDSNEEKRTSSRYELDNFQRVREVDTGDLIGYLGDISLVGLKVLGKRRVPVGERYKLRLNYICMGGEKESTSIDVESIWEREEENMPYREIGFRFLDLPKETQSHIERIMTDLRDRATAA